MNKKKGSRMTPRFLAWETILMVILLTGIQKEEQVYKKDDWIVQTELLTGQWIFIALK